MNPLLPIRPINRPQRPAPVLPPAAVYPLRGANLDRQSRFDARSARRWGDWTILDVPASLVWLQDEILLTAAEDSLGLLPAPIIDLWP